MKVRMDRLRELEVLLAIAQTGSLTSAARHLRTSAPTITRILASLEDRAGISLFHRTSHRCELTDSGAKLAAHARETIAGYEEALKVARGDALAPTGNILLTAPLTFGRNHVAPALVRFLDEFPSINAELRLADDVVDLRRGRIDLAVRIGPILDPGLVLNRIGHVRQVTVASPVYLAARGAPKHPQEVALHDVIQHSGRGAETPWQYTVAGGIVSVRVSPRFTVNQADAAISAARAGRGLVRALSYQVHQDIAEGKLVVVLARYEVTPLPVSVVFPEERRNVRRVRLLSEFLTRSLRELDVVNPVAAR